MTTNTTVGVPEITGKYQMLPPPTPEEYAALEESIREDGVLVPPIDDENGDTIDGFTRKEIAGRLGKSCVPIVVTGLTDDQKKSMALTLNIHRRHLNFDQKRKAIAQYIELNPTASNSKVAKHTGVSDKTVDSVRKGIAQNSEIPKIEPVFDGSKIDWGTDPRYHKPSERAKWVVRHCGGTQDKAYAAELAECSVGTITTVKQIAGPTVATPSRSKAKLTVVDSKPKPTPAEKAAARKEARREAIIGEIATYLADLRKAAESLDKYTRDNGWGEAQALKKSRGDILRAKARNTQRIADDLNALAAQADAQQQGGES